MNSSQKRHARRYRPLLWRNPANIVSLEQAHYEMLSVMKMVDSRVISPRLIELAWRLYRNANDGLASPVWQAIAGSRRTPMHIFEDLHHMRRWYIDIELVNNSKISKAILEAYANLEKEKTHNLKDKNRELRTIARKRLGWPPLDDEDDE